MFCLVTALSLDGMPNPLNPLNCVGGWIILKTWAKDNLVLSLAADRLHQTVCNF